MTTGFLFGLVTGIVLTLILATVAINEGVKHWLCRRKGHQWRWRDDGEMFCRRCKWEPR